MSRPFLDGDKSEVLHRAQADIAEHVIALMQDAMLEGFVSNPAEAAKLLKEAIQTQRDQVVKVARLLERGNHEEAYELLARLYPATMKRKASRKKSKRSDSTGE